MTDKIHKMMIDTMKNSIPEKTIVEFFLNMEDEGGKLNPIGHNKDMESEFKNDLFDAIYEDENGKIIDLRILEKKPSQEDLYEMAQYWDEMQRHFNKKVQPCFVITCESQ